MKKYLSILFAATTAVSLVACNAKKEAPAPEEKAAPKYLVLYYSQTGATKIVAEELQRELGADIEQIEAVEPYDGTYQETIARGQEERKNSTMPQVNPLQSNLADYDVIFLGYPIWFGTYALPIAGLLEAYDFAGKQVVPFCTFGSGGLESSIALLKEALPKAEITNGYGVRNARITAAPRELDRFLKEEGYLEGEVEPLANYSDQQPITDAEKALFDAACGGYPMPLGTPVSLGKRSTSSGTDYKFSVNSKMGDGSEVAATIYVTVGNAPDATPEFVRIVR